MTGTITPDRPVARAGRDGFPQLVRAEWTKFRTVRGWVVAMVVAALVTVLLGMVASSGSKRSCSGPDGGACAPPPTGPGGETVSDRFTFVHRSMSGDGTITVRVTSLTGQVAAGPAEAGQQPPAGEQGEPEPWAKAGLIVKDGTKQGSAYAAVMVTGGHGVRMQHDFTEDTAGRAGDVSATSPRWLRLTRTGDTLTGYESADGAHWTVVGTARPAGLRSTVEVGLFVTSPEHVRVTGRGSGVSGDPTQATAGFDQVGLQGAWTEGEWRSEELGGGGGGAPRTPGGGVRRSGGGFTVSGSGDIAPSVGPVTLERSLGGAFAALIVVIIVGTMFVTAEYRRGLIRTTLTASPRRGRVLAAKAVVIASVTFVAGLAGAAVAVPLGVRILRHNGNFVFPVPWPTEVRVVAGTAALLAVAAVLALAVGTLLRRSAAAVTTVIAVVVLPFLLAIPSILPVGGAEWMLRFTPAAAFAIQQSVPRYPQVADACTPGIGCYPLAPWTGFAVLCGYTALALTLAVVMLRRRDV